MDTLAHSHPMWKLIQPTGIWWVCWNKSLATKKNTKTHNVSICVCRRYRQHFVHNRHPATTKTQLMPSNAADNSDLHQAFHSHTEGRCTEHKMAALGLTAVLITCWYTRYVTVLFDNYDKTATNCTKKKPCNSVNLSIWEVIYNTLLHCNRATQNLFFDARHV